MFQSHIINKKEERYCVLHDEEKGYYLTRLKIARSLNCNPVEAGSKKDCEIFIKKVNFLIFMSEWKKWGKRNFELIKRS